MDVPVLGGAAGGGGNGGGGSGGGGGVVKGSSAMRGKGKAPLGTKKGVKRKPGAEEAGGSDEGGEGLAEIRGMSLKDASKFFEMRVAKKVQRKVLVVDGKTQTDFTWLGSKCKKAKLELSEPKEGVQDDDDDGAGCSTSAEILSDNISSSSESEVSVIGCPICLTDFSSDLPPYVASCGHAICHVCLMALERCAVTLPCYVSGHVRNLKRFPCPECRSQQSFANYFKLNLHAFQTRGVNTQKDLTGPLEDIKNSLLLPIFTCSREWLEEEASNLKAVPTSVNKGSLIHQLPIFIKNLEIESRIIRASMIKEKVKKGISRLETLLGKIQREVPEQASRPRRKNPPFRLFIPSSSPSQNVSVGTPSQSSNQE